MERFAARAFYQIGRLLERVKTAHTLNISKTLRLEGPKVYTSAPDAEVTDGDKRGLEMFYAAIKDHCERIGLRLSVMHVERLRGDLKENLTNQDVVTGLNELDFRIRDEIETNLFLFVSPAHAEFYLHETEDEKAVAALAGTSPLRDRKEKLWGKGVQDAFPSAAFDLEEAGKCLALGRATACVMHLSRVVETGLKALVKELGLPPRPDWGRHLADIDKELTNRYKTSCPRTPDELFFSEIAAQIGHIKTAWRNPTMHVDRTYNDETAEEIFMAVRSFMRDLATKLHE